MPEPIKMTTPLVELDGDEMTRVIWGWVKEILLQPYIELKTEYYDLGLKQRELSRDQVTLDAAAAIRRHGVGVKCATITPNADRVAEYGLSEMYRSPNGTIRALLDGTVFRAPIITTAVAPYIANWRKPITIARHAYGDIYKNSEVLIGGQLAGAKVELVATAPDGSEHRTLVHSFSQGTGSGNAAADGGAAGTAAAGVDGVDGVAGVAGMDGMAAAGGAGLGLGIVQGVHNTDASIISFAHACMRYALDTRQDLWFGAKDTISKTYDRRFRDIFDAVFAENYQRRFAALGIEYFYSLIDDIVARVIRSEGGFIWACRNYDGDVMSDMVATAFGSLAMMTSVLVSPQGCYEYEAAHGTVQRHYYRYLDGGQTSTNSMATLFAWTGALRKRGELDGLPALSAFADSLEAAAIATIEDGVMTADLLPLSTLENKAAVDTRTFLLEVARRLEM